VSTLDWIIVLVLNSGVIVLGVWLARGTRSSRQWFLGGRSLPWWAVGLSMFATNLDNGDLVSISGKTFREGLHILSVHTIGGVIAGILVAFWIVPVLYRARLYTNAEYLEARFGPSTRVISALIQIQYRSSMLGLIVWTLFVVLTTLCGLGDQAAWVVVVSLAVLAGLYTAWGGLRSVVFTDAAQAVIMFAGAAVIFFCVLDAAGGWSGMEERLHELDEVDVESGMRTGDLSRISTYHGKSGKDPALVILLGWIVVAGGYWTVNHTQTMRLLGSRSLWDAQIAALFGTALSIPIMIACGALGLFGRALFPDFDPPDHMYPHLASVYLGAGWRGLVVAGLLAAAVSTFDSMGSALSAVFTRDVYARILVRHRDDAHYVRVSRIATVAILALGFAYLPFVMSKDTMLEAFLTLIPVFVTPLFTIYLAGIFTRAHRRSGLVGLIVGGGYGLVALLGREQVAFESLPDWLTGNWPAYLWSVAITAAAIAVTTCLRGRDDGRLVLRGDDDGWLARSRDDSIPAREHPFAGDIPKLLRPQIFAVALLLVAAYLVFAVLW